MHLFPSFIVLVVRYRAFVSSPSFKAFDSSITIDIKVNQPLLERRVYLFVLSVTGRPCVSESQWCCGEAALQDQGCQWHIH